MKNQYIFTDEAVGIVNGIAKSTIRTNTIGRGDHFMGSQYAPLYCELKANWFSLVKTYKKKGNQEEKESKMEEVITQEESNELDTMFHHTFASLTIQDPNKKW